MKRLSALSALALTSTMAFAHAKLQTSTPADAAVVSPAPGELRLTYNEPVEVAMSAVKLTGPNGVVVPVEKVAAVNDDEKTLVQPLPKLASGDYRAQWSTMGHDGHHTMGEIHFTVK